MDIPVLKYLDVLIGLSLVMVLGSTVVLAVTQVILNVTFARSRHLQRGLTRLILQTEPDQVRAHAPYIAKLIVRHPLIGRQTLLTPLRKMIAARRAATAPILPPVRAGSVVQREELAYLLIEFAAGEGPLMDPAEQGAPPPHVVQAREALAAALAINGVEDPAATLRAIRLKVVQNERAEPDLPASRWRADAVADVGANDFIAKLHANFDNTIARVSDGFSAESKLWVAAVAFVVAFALQLDTLHLLRRLSVDDGFRAALVDVGAKLDQQKIAEASPAEQQELALRIAEARESYALLASPTFNLVPATFPPAGERLAALGRPGVLISWVLLLLGAPFWFDALKNLLRLRSVMARKDDAERKQREGVQTLTKRSDAAKVASAARTDGDDEAGNLAATGAVG